MAINLVDNTEKNRFHINTVLLTKRTATLLDALDISSQKISIVLMDDAEMARYNADFRHKKGPTNVLSFPASELYNDLPAGLIENQLGDVLISVETARKEARNKYCSLHHRICELIIHGTLHLLGYDHERSTREALIMWEKEQQLIQQMTRSRRKYMPYLAINVDHVATVRQARGTIEPDPVHAAAICELAGADGIVVHLREDRRHMQDRDVYLLRKTVKTRLNLEMAATKEMIDIALDLKPEMITLVPEKRQELTTEGGLDVVANEKKMKKVINKMSKAKIPVSLFIDPDAAQIEAALEVGATFVELHTGRYCDATTEEEQHSEFRLIEQSAELAFESGLKVNAGHGLDYRTSGRVASLPTIHELSIGHAIIARSVYVGLDQAVREMRDCILVAG